MRALTQHGPLRVQRLFHPEPDGAAHVYLVHPPGGLVPGDRLAIEARVEEGGVALLTTPGATKVHRSDGRTSESITELHVARGATLEHVPQETIVFDGALAAIRTRVTLAADARFLGWEVVCLGRPASGERFERGALQLALEVAAADGTPRLIDRGTFHGGAAVMHAPWGLGGRAALGTFVSTDGDLDVIRDVIGASMSSERTVSDAIGSDPIAAATRVSGLVVVRALGSDAGAVRRVFERARHVVRATWGRAAIDPAIWRT